MRLPKLSDFSPYLQLLIASSDGEMVFIDEDDPNFHEEDAECIKALLDEYPDLRDYIEVDLEGVGGGDLVTMYCGLCAAITGEG